MPTVNQTWFNRPKIDYETPNEIFAPLQKEFGITIDVCASRENSKCSRFYSISENAFKQKWEGVCWMNPPFGREMKKWVKKAYESAKDGAVVICLLPARTNTNWWHDYCMRGEIRFIRGEVKFVGCKNGLWMPMAIVIFSQQRIAEAQAQLALPMGAAE